MDQIGSETGTSHEAARETGMPLEVVPRGITDRELGVAVTAVRRAWDREVAEALVEQGEAPVVAVVGDNCMPACKKYLE